MARFHVHRRRVSNQEVPYLLDVQADLLANLRTRVVVPLIPLARFGTPMSGLNPVFEIEGVEMVMSTAEIAGVEVALLGDTVVSLDHEWHIITQALDFLFQGF